MKSRGSALIIFCRFPEPGSVKSRLARGIGKRSAARIYEKLFRRTLGIVQDFQHCHPECAVFLAVHPPDSLSRMKPLIPEKWRILPQPDGHLGDKMAETMRFCLRRGHHPVVLIGSDLVDLQVEDLHRAFRTLDTHDTVLGPASDGGFYLIGCRKPPESALMEPTWGTSYVLERTIKHLKKEELSVVLLRRRHDVDRPEDLDILRRDPWFTSRLSVIVPTLREKSRLDPWLDSWLPYLWPGDEILLVHATPKAPKPARNCRHGTWKQIFENGVRLRSFSTLRGRGRQLRAGGRHATGNILLFLHDDTTPPPLFAYHARKIAVRREYALGCFQLGFSPTHPGLDMIARWANLRSRIFHLPYGDQAIFCRKSSYEKRGGIQNDHLMEDVELVKRLRREGKLMIIPHRVVTSGRRYLKTGILRTSIKNHFTFFAYLLGTSETRLYRFYYDRPPCQRTTP